MAAFRRRVRRFAALLAIASISAFAGSARAAETWTHAPADESLAGATEVFGPEETPCWFAYDRATAYCRHHPVPLLRVACKGVATLVYMACVWKGVGGNIPDR